MNPARTQTLTQVTTAWFSRTNRVDNDDEINSVGVLC